MTITSASKQAEQDSVELSFGIKSDEASASRHRQIKQASAFQLTVIVTYKTTSLNCTQTTVDWVKNYAIGVYAQGDCDTSLTTSA